VTEVEYATECYSESPGRLSLSPATKKRSQDQVEADMSDMTSMSESEIHAMMEEQARIKQEDQRKFLEYRSNTRGDLGWHFRCCSYLTLSPSVQPLAATATLLRRQHSRVPTAPSARTGIPVKQAQGLHPSSEDDDEPPQLVSGCFEGGDTMAAMCIERMARKGAAAGPPVICWAHVQGLGRGQAASYEAPCTNQAAEFNSRRHKEQRKAEAPGKLALHGPPITPMQEDCTSEFVCRFAIAAGLPLTGNICANEMPVLILPIPELDQQRLISSKVSSICFSLCLSSHCGPLQYPGPPRRRHHPSKTTRRQVHLSISVWAAYTTQAILHSVSC
jgi:hypothetical protein